MRDMRKRIAASFDTQGLMATIGAKLVEVSDGEVHIALPFSERISQQYGYVHAGAITSIVDHFLAIGRVQKSGQFLTVCTGEVRASSGTGSAYKVVALMQATIVNVRQ